jgi:hypothetical protein
MAVLLDRIDRVGGDAQAFIDDRRVEGREIDHPQRLGPKHEWIVLHAFGIDLGLQRQIADFLQALGSPAAKLAAHRDSSKSFR